ncbi:uncharacterized protein OCT59_029694 [Rhizophagus irregularis]|uniref:uncharacterized protein n=1 Tax=Rhizophagus irregularis TaxID=588596 RepID=UPI00332B557A|nr:hypothetical protein OCT59_029694 [Rhizophagus irregularis]
MEERETFLTFPIFSLRPSACSNFGSWILIGKFGTEEMIGFSQLPGLGILENGSVSGNMEIRIMASDFEFMDLMSAFATKCCKTLF